jgi:hypothetical protein
MVATGSGFTRTTTSSVAEQPLASVIVTVYVVVSVGVATGLATVELDNPVAGDHTYEIPPLADKVVAAPIQIVLSEPALAIGSGFTTIFLGADVASQPFKSSMVTW